MKRKILIVAAHPDDEILGCGGTVAKLVKKGNRAYTLILGEGLTARQESKKSDIERLKKQALRANSIIGIKDVFFCDFPDNRFDSVTLLDIVKEVEIIKNKIKPSVVYTHHRGDLNIDHRITFKAVLTACRPKKSEPVKEIYSFEIPSSTEWTFPTTFAPNLFENIASTIGIKKKALKEYKAELCKFPHPRSEKAIMATSVRWGSMIGVSCAEVFEAVRVIR